MIASHLQLEAKPEQKVLGTSERVRLGDIVTFVRGVTFDKSQARQRSGGQYVPILRAGNIGDTLDLENDLVWVPPTCLSDEQFLRPGDLAICMSSGSPAVVGKTALLIEPWCGSVGAFCGIIRPGHRVHPEFLALWFRAGDFREWRDRQARGASIQNLRFSQFADLEISIPPLKAQEQFARRLKAQVTAVDCARAAAQSRIDAAQALSAAYLREAFGEAPPLSATPLRPSVPIHPGWRWHLLGDIARLATGHTPSRREPSWWGGDVHWLQLPDIRAVDGHRVLSTLEQTNELGLANSAAVLLPEGTVCMSRTASVGFVTILGRAMATSQDFVNWVCGPELDPDFLMYLILRCRREIRELGSGATHHSIYFETVENFSVCVPPIAEQRRIAANLSRRLGEVERLVGTIRAEIAAIEALPTALLREAFQPTV